MKIRYDYCFAFIFNILSTIFSMTFRSIEMKHYQLVIPREMAYTTISQLGQEEMVHILDTGDPMDRPFFQQLKRCDEALYKINSMGTALKK